MEHKSKDRLDASGEHARFPADGGVALAFRKPEETPSATQLIALVEEALEMADRLEFGIVGIDLSMALERLKAVTGTTCPRE